MSHLTHRQKQIMDIVVVCQRNGVPTPPVREIAARLGVKSPGTVADHLAALRRKGFLENPKGRARSLRVRTPLDPLRRTVVDVPVYGSIPAGFAEDHQQEARGCISVDVGSLGIRTTTRTFALQVRGDSMVGKHILDGDFVIFEHGVTPRSGDVVAALIDNESTLKTFIMEKGKPWLRAENPKYPKLIPASELLIQGIMVSLIRKRK